MADKPDKPVVRSENGVKAAPALLTLAQMAARAIQGGDVGTEVTITLSEGDMLVMAKALAARVRQTQQQKPTEVTKALLTRGYKILTQIENASPEIGQQIAAYLAKPAKVWKRKLA